MSKVLFNFNNEGISNDRLRGVAERVSVGMKGNQYFPGSETYGTDLLENLNRFNTLVAEAATGTASQKAEVRKAKQSLQVSLRSAASFVNFKTTDRVLLLTTGFDLNKETRTPSVLGPIRNFSAVPGTAEGTLKAGFSKPAGMKGAGFQWFYGDVVTNDTLWVTVTNGDRCSALITGLTPLRIMTVRAYAEGARGQKVYSQPITCAAGLNLTAKRA